MDYFRVKLIMFLFISLCFILKQTAYGLTSWPDEQIQSIQAINYGSACNQCTMFLSLGYCVHSCCRSCRAEAMSRDIDPISACNSVCGLRQTLTPDDRDFINECRANRSIPGCSLVQDPSSSVERTTNPQTDRAFERRVQSCNEAIAYTNRYCSEQHLNSVFPQDLFRLAQDIANASDCNLTNVQNYNLRLQTANPQDSLGLCENHYNDCRTFCFDQNVVQSESSESLTNIEGHRKYENECQPNRANFIRQRGLRETIIQQANQRAQTCLAEETTAPTERTLAPTVQDPTPAPSRLRTTLNNMFQNPETALSNANNIISAIQPFMPQNQPNNSISTEVARTATPNARSYGLTQEELYGPNGYQGSNTSDATDLDFELEDRGFDQPQGLRNSAQNPNQQQPFMGAGGNPGMGGQPGGSGNQNKPGSRGSGRRAEQKDKTLFGRSEQGGLVATPSANTNENPNSAAARNSKASNNLEKTFDASKYHDMIIASYAKGINSENHRRAARRAAGHIENTPSRLQSRGYTSWHLENKIHPQGISLFMQTRICYNTKFSTGFRLSCELRN